MLMLFCQLILETVDIVVTCLLFCMRKLSIPQCFYFRCVSMALHVTAFTCWMRFFEIHCISCEFDSVPLSHVMALTFSASSFLFSSPFFLCLHNLLCFHHVLFICKEEDTFMLWIHNRSRITDPSSIVVLGGVMSLFSVNRSLWLTCWVSPRYWELD